MEIDVKDTAGMDPSVRIGVTEVSYKDVPVASG
jgi:hypothetical protein